uniref:RNA-dependent RNA polymerase n=1 Tax=Heterobasidion ourmia-like virus 4 TaxID=3075374 RepID=A0AA96C2A9_9VIRU|nr:RNA-dependent RNA polymerase [Heterobasidion ourmia-like virus 4]
MPIGTTHVCEAARKVGFARKVTRGLSQLQKNGFLSKDVEGLVRPNVITEKNVVQVLKKLKSGLAYNIENNVGPNTSEKEFSIFATEFLARKSLPSPPGQKPLPAYYEKLNTGRPHNDDFLFFSSSEIPKMFPLGWDADYVKMCEMVSVSIKACTEAGRNTGGSRGYINRTFTHKDFLEAVLDGKIRRMNPMRKVVLVDDAGKQRIVTIASALQFQLLPLHLLLYKYISKYDWLLRGDAKPSMFKEFTLPSPAEKGEEIQMVSGDYESATDNFILAHSHHILCKILSQSMTIPAGIKKLALSSLRSTLLRGKNEFVRQNSGQLMGNLLSFPLLCITNYLTFKMAVPRKVPVKINGDDIVFRARKKEVKKWFDTVEKSGLVVSKGKTLVHRRFFSLNSTFFVARRSGKPGAVPVIRSKSIFNPVDPLENLSVYDRLSSCTNIKKGEALEKIKRIFIEHNGREIRRSGCSLNRGWGIRCSRSLLGACGLWEREVFYLSLPKQLDKRAEDRGQKTPGWIRMEGIVGKKDWENRKRRADQQWAWDKNVKWKKIKGVPLVLFRGNGAGGDFWTGMRVMGRFGFSKKYRRKEFKKLSRRYGELVREGTFIRGREKKSHAWVPEGEVAEVVRGRVAGLVFVPGPTPI